MSLLKECLEINQDPIDALPLLEMLDESIRALNLQKKGGLVNAKGAKSLFKANPQLVTKAATLAINGLNQYNKYLRNTVKLHAKSAYERKMMTTIVDSMKNSGKFKIFRIKYEGGGKTWTMRYKK